MVRCKYTCWDVSSTMFVFCDCFDDFLEHYVPVTKETVTYIVAGIFFNDQGELLMMQEAKKSCYESWYLPAGRMEPNETIEVRDSA